MRATMISKGAVRVGVSQVSLDNKFACIFVVSCESTSSASLAGISREFAERSFLSDFPDRRVHLPRIPLDSNTPQSPLGHPHSTIASLPLSH